MITNHVGKLRADMEFTTSHNRFRAGQIETMIAEFNRLCTDLGQQIEAEEARARIYDPTHFAYPTYAKAARERRANVEESAKALSKELNRLRLEATEASSLLTV